MKTCFYTRIALLLFLGLLAMPFVALARVGGMSIDDAASWSAPVADAAWKAEVAEPTAPELFDIPDKKLPDSSSKAYYAMFFDIVFDDNDQPRKKKYVVECKGGSEDGIKKSVSRKKEIASAIKECVNGGGTANICSEGYNDDPKINLLR